MPKWWCTGFLSWLAFMVVINQNIIIVIAHASVSNIYMYKSFKRWQDQHHRSKLFEPASPRLPLPQPDLARLLLELEDPLVEDRARDLRTAHLLLEATRHHARAEELPARHALRQLILLVDLARPLSHHPLDLLLDVPDRFHVAAHFVQQVDDGFGQVLELLLGIELPARARVRMVGFDESLGNGGGATVMAQER